MGVFKVRRIIYNGSIGYCHVINWRLKESTICWDEEMLGKAFVYEIESFSEPKRGCQLGTNEKYDNI
jgi:hypothetical protein